MRPCCMTPPESQSEILRRHRQARVRGLLSRIRQQLPSLVIAEQAGNRPASLGGAHESRRRRHPPDARSRSAGLLFALGQPFNQPARGKTGLGSRSFEQLHEAVFGCRGVRLCCRALGSTHEMTAGALWATTYRVASSPSRSQVASTLRFLAEDKRQHSRLGPPYGCGTRECSVARIPSLQLTFSY